MIDSHEIPRHVIKDKKKKSEVLAYIGLCLLWFCMSKSVQNIVETKIYFGMKFCTTLEFSGKTLFL